MRRQFDSAKWWEKKTNVGRFCWFFCCFFLHQSRPWLYLFSRFKGISELIDLQSSHQKFMNFWINYRIKFCCRQEFKSNSSKLPSQTFHGRFHGLKIWHLTMTQTRLALKLTQTVSSMSSHFSGQRGISSLWNYSLCWAFIPPDTTTK